MKKSIFAGILICIAVIAGAYYMFQKERPADTMTAANIPSSSVTALQTESTVASQSISQNESSDEGDIKIDEMGDTVSTCDFNYTINSVTKTKDYFRHEFMGNEKQTYNVGFIVEDEDFKSDNLLMLINPDGTYPYDEAARYISLHY